MAKFSYNGVLLPEIPAVEGYGHVAIRYDEANSRIDCIFSQKTFYYTGSTIRNTAGSSYKRYIASISNPVEWAESSDTNYQGWTIATNRRLLWSNHDIPNGSATSTTIYFYGTDPVPENEAKPKELQYEIYHNFYPYSGGITYEAGTKYVNYVVPVVEHSTYTVTMTEVGTRLRSVFTTVDPAAITSSITGCTDIVMNPTFAAGYTFTYFAQEDGWMVVYVSNAGERPKISIVTNGAGGDGAPLYDRKYLVRSGSTIYTVTDGALTSLAETEITANLFQTYGVDDLPDGALLVGLTDPEILYWHDSMDELPTLSLTVKGTPPLPQVITSEPQDLTHETIIGVDYAPETNDVIGYSNMDVSDADDPKRGSLNQSESGQLEDGTGYRFVFDFSTSQGNGEISALSLTSQSMGACGYGSKQFENFEGNYDNTSVYVAGRIISGNSKSIGAVNSRMATSITSFDIENSVAYAVEPVAKNKLAVYKFNYFTDSAGLFTTKLFKNSVQETVTEITTTAFLSSLLTSTASDNYVGFCDGEDGYIWGFQISGNASRGTTVLWIKINKTD